MYTKLKTIAFFSFNRIAGLPDNLLIVLNNV